MALPLQGVRVLDLSHVIAGPMASFYLAQLGADVIKIESPAGGDVMRAAKNPADAAAGDTPSGFTALNAGKRSFSVDIRTPEEWADTGIPEGAIRLDMEGAGFEARLAGVKLDNPGKTIMVMGNHGVMVTAPTVAQAFDELYYFERACETYIKALWTGRPLRVLPDAVAEKVAEEIDNYPVPQAARHLGELKLILDEEGSTYRD